MTVWSVTVGLGCIVGGTSALCDEINVVTINEKLHCLVEDDTVMGKAVIPW